MRKFIKNLKNSILWKILMILLTIAKWAIEILIIGIAIVIVTQRVTNSEKAFLGFRIFNVATGSMEPEYAVGDILIVREKDPSTIVEGDNIVYLGNTADYNGKIITHNVIEVEQNEEGDYLFHTKGIANTIEDPIVHEDQLYGIVVQNNRVLAFICKILLNKYGLYFCVIIPIILFAFIEFVKIQGEKIEAEREEERKRLEEKRKRKQKRLEKQQIEEVQEDFEENVEEVEEVEVPKKTTKKSATKKKTESKPSSEEDLSKTTKTKTKKSTETKLTNTKKTGSAKQTKTIKSKKTNEE